MQPVLVDAEGQVWSVVSPFFWMRPRQPDGNIVGYAVATLGFIHIWSVDDLSIVVSLRPDLVHPQTMAAAFYAIADLRPLRVFVSPANTTKQQWELFKCIRCALKRIDQLVTAVRRSSIGIKLLRISLFLLKMTDHSDPRITLIPSCARGYRRRHGDAARLVSPPVRAPRRAAPRHGKAAIAAVGRLAPFLTSLAAVSSLSFAV